MKKVLVFLTIIFSLLVVYSQEIKTIAIMDFEAKGVDKNSASVVSDLFRDNLFASKKFTVVDRNSMNEILKEQNLQQSLGCSSTECAVKIGRVLGVQGMIVGTLGKLGNAYILSTRLVNVENAKIIWTKSAKVYDFNRIDEGVSALVDDLVNSIISGNYQTQSSQATQQVQQPQKDDSQNITVIYQNQQQQSQQMPQQRGLPQTYNSPPIGFDLELGFSFLYNYYFDHAIPSSDYDYAEWGNQSYFHLKLGFYFNGINLGFNLKSFNMPSGTTVNYSMSYPEGSDEGTFVTNSDWYGTLLNFSLGYRMKTGKAGYSLFSLTYTGFTSDNFSDASFGGPGIDLYYRLGGLDNHKTVNSSPIGGMFELNLNFAYLFYNADDPSYVDPNFSAMFGGGIGVGIMFKPFGAYLMLGYDINIHYTTWDDLDVMIINHGIELKLGINFDFQSILG